MTLVRDDVRENPIITALERLTGKGKSDFRSQNRSESDLRVFLVTSLPYIGKLLTRDLQGMLEWADGIVLAQRPSKADATKIQAAGKPVFDLVRCGASG